ncbi:DUF2577 domain-containing protein [Faecalimicrobium sp. JNUCC 81]
MPNLVEIIKQAALEAFKESKPMEIIYGTVEKEYPLEIRIDQKRLFTETFLVLSNAVKDFKTRININGITQECTIYNSLKKNEKVILLRFHDGQKYLVLDRM